MRMLDMAENPSETELEVLRKGVFALLELVN